MSEMPPGLPKHPIGTFAFVGLYALLKPGIWDRLGLWFVVAVILVIIAHAIPLSDFFGLTRYGSPGYTPF